jgi:hypothetical protein
MNANEHPAWTGQAVRLLDESAQALDAATLSRLNRARQAALMQRPARRRNLVVWLPAGLAGACALFLAVGVWQARTPMPARPLPVQAAVGSGDSINANDLELISSGDNLEMVQDLDFYAWLGSQDQDNDG